MRAIMRTYWLVISPFFNTRPPPLDGSLTITPSSSRPCLPLLKCSDERRPLEYRNTVAYITHLGHSLPLYQPRRHDVSRLIAYNQFASYGPGLSIERPV